MITMGQIWKLGGKTSQFGKDVMVQTKNRFLPDPCLEMETETKDLSCFLWTSICLCVCVCLCILQP